MRLTADPTCKARLHFRLFFTVEASPLSLGPAGSCCSPPECSQITRIGEGGGAVCNPATSCGWAAAVLEQMIDRTTTKDGLNTRLMSCTEQELFYWEKLKQNHTDMTRFLASQHRHKQANTEWRGRGLVCVCVCVCVCAHARTHAHAGIAASSPAREMH